MGENRRRVTLYAVTIISFMEMKADYGAHKILAALVSELNLMLEMVGYNVCLKITIINANEKPKKQHLRK